MFKKRNPNRIREGSLAATVIMYVIAGAICLIALYPFYYVFIQSFTQPEEVVKGTTYIWPKEYYFGSYELLIKDAKLWRAYGNTLFYVAVGTVLNLITAVLGAYPLSVRNLAGRNFVVKYLVITMYFSGGLIPTFLIMTKLGLYNNIWAMIIPGAVNVWNIILVRTFFIGTPDALRESAMLDGAGHLRILWSIMVPLAKPVLAVVAIYTIVGIWNSWFNAMVYLRDSTLHPLQLYLYRVMIQQTASIADVTDPEAMKYYMQQILKNYQLKYALIIFSTLPVIFTYPFFQKYFVKGVMIGSLKE